MPLLFCKLPQTPNPAILNYPVKSVLLHRWGNSAGCQLISDRLERGFLALCGVVNDAAVYFIMIRGGFLGSLDEIFIFYR